MAQSSAAFLALDVGDQRIGVATANADVRMAHPLTTLQNETDVLPKIVMLAKEHDVATVVVGLPRGMDGQETTQTKKVRDFAAELQGMLGQTIEFQDEAVTSIVAEDKLKASGKPYSKEDIDMYAAAEILQDYLDMAQKEYA